jgi:hypothetical protein
MGEAEVIPLRGAGGRPRPRPAPRRRGVTERSSGAAPEGSGTGGADGGTVDGYRVDGGGATGAELVPARPSELESAVTEVASFLRRRLAGRYPVDEFGFDPDLNENVILP